MVEQILTKEMIEAGESLLRLMDEKKMKPDAVLWFYFPDIQKYKLLIAMPKERQLGPKKFYKKDKQGVFGFYPNKSAMPPCAEQSRKDYCGCLAKRG